MTATLDAELAKRWRWRVPQTLISIGPWLTVPVVLFALPESASGNATPSEDVTFTIGFAALLCVALSGIAARIPAQLATIAVCAFCSLSGSGVALVASILWTLVLALDQWCGQRQATVVRARSPRPTSLDVPASAARALVLRTRELVLDAAWAAATVGAIVWAFAGGGDPALILIGVAATVTVRRPLTRWIRARATLRTARAGRPLACRVRLLTPQSAEVSAIDGEREIALLRRLAWLGPPMDPTNWREATVYGMERDGSMAILLVSDEAGPHIALTTKPVRDPWLAEPDLDLGTPFDLIDAF